VTYTYDNSATVPTTAGKYEAKANFNVSGEYEYLTPEALTASVRLVSDNATIGAHGANGFEINFTLSNQTATATDWKVNNDVYWAAGDYEEALNNSAYAVNGVSHIQNKISLIKYCVLPKAGFAVARCYKRLRLAERKIYLRRAIFS